MNCLIPRLPLRGDEINGERSTKPSCQQCILDFLWLFKQLLLAMGFLSVCAEKPRSLGTKLRDYITVATLLVGVVCLESLACSEHAGSCMPQDYNVLQSYR